MPGSDLHISLKTEVVSKLNAGRAEIALARLQWSKSDVGFSIHVKPTTYSVGGRLQTTDWLSFLGFQHSAKCPFTGECFARSVPEDFDLGAFATAFNSGYAHLEKAEDGLEACGFYLPHPQGLSFFLGGSREQTRRGPALSSGDGHNAMSKETMKKSEDDKFFFHFSFIDMGRNKAFVTHYRPKHPPLSSELRSVFRYLGLQEFHECPEFDFEPCFYRSIEFIGRGNSAFGGNVEASHRAFDAHQKQFAPAVENLLAAQAAAEAVGMTFLPFEKPSTRMRADIASNVTRSAKAVAVAKTTAKAAPSSPMPDSFDVAISFAGPEREHAETLAEIVRGAGYAVFYDDYYPEHLWGKNLTVFFDEIFRKRARFCVMFVSKDYRDRKWTSHEARSAQARALDEKGNEYILPIRVDDTELEGLLPTVGYVPIATGINKIGEILLKKLKAK